MSGKLDTPPGIKIMKTEKVLLRRQKKTLTDKKPLLKKILASFKSRLGYLTETEVIRTNENTKSEDAMTTQSI
jgi:hypothetical protein